MKRGYSLSTQRLIDRMCRNVERKDFVLDKEKGAELVLKTYDLFNLPRPKKIKWVVDIFDKEFDRSAGYAWSTWSARSARTAWSAWYAGSAWSARSARSARTAGIAGSAWSARSARTARSARSTWLTALDEDSYCFVFEHEYCKNPTGQKPNINDKLYLKYSNLLMEAIECGVGYRVEWEDTLYLVPDRLCRIDEQNRFHNESGPAIWWKKGAEFYFIHGVEVTEKIVMFPEKLTKKDWLNEKNMEVRRIIQDRMPNFVKRIGGKSLQKDKHGELISVDLGSDPEKTAMYVKLKDSSTARIFYLRVPPTVKTTQEALAWSFILAEEEYKPEVET